MRRNPREALVGARLGFYCFPGPMAVAVPRRVVAVSAFLHPLLFTVLCTLHPSFLASVCSGIPNNQRTVQIIASWTTPCPAPNLRGGVQSVGVKCGLTQACLGKYADGSASDAITPSWMLQPYFAVMSSANAVTIPDNAHSGRRPGNSRLFLPGQAWWVAHA